MTKIVDIERATSILNWLILYYSFDKIIEVMKNGDKPWLWDDERMKVCRDRMQ